MNVSPFRNVNPHQYRCLYKDLETSKAPSSHGIAANDRLVAFVEGESCVSVLPLDFKGRPEDKTSLRAHGGKVTDLKFSPFDQNILTTSATDGTVKIWNLAESSVSSSIDDLSGPVHTIQFHPGANNILAAGSKQAVSIIDVGQGSVVHSLQRAKKNTEVTGLTWNFDGTLLIGMDKTKNIFVFDPRTNPDIESLQIKTKVRPHQLIHLGSDGHILACGNDMYRKAVIKIYDPRNPEEPILSHSPPFSSGFSLTQYDEDSQMFYLSVRGSTQMNIYDLSSGYGSLNQVEKYIGETAFQGFAKVPKYVLDVENAEITRFVKSSETTVEAIGMLIPRKAQEFDDKIFPLSASNEPAMTAEDWCSGENKEPLKKSLHPKLKKYDVEPVLLDQKKDFQKVEPKTKIQNYDASPYKKEEEKKEFVHVISDKRKKMDAGFTQSTFLHTSGSEPRSLHMYYHHLQVKKESLPLANNIQCNSKFFAFAWNTIGGSGLAVRSLSEFGRCDDKIPLVRGHDSQVSTYTLSPLQHNLLSTGSDDGRINVWQIPDAGLTEDLTAAFYVFQENGRVSSLRLHDQVEDILAGASKGFDGYPFKIYDVNAGEEVFVLDCHEKDVWDIAWGYNPALVATTCKDKHTRVLDPRANSVVHQFDPAESVRDTRVMWLGDTNRILTSGFAKRSERRFSMWDLRDTSKPVATKGLDKSSGHLLPFYDEDTQLLFVTAVGERKHSVYSVQDTAFTELAGWQSEHLNVGVYPLPKLLCDVKTVEIGKFLKITQDAVIPVSVKVPRKRKEFFQDDIFPPTRSMESLMGASEWAGGKDAEPKIVSLQPAGMENLSEAPAEEMTDRQKKHLEHLSEVDKRKSKTGALSGEEAIDEWKKVAESSPASNRWDAVIEESHDIDEDEWGDDSD